MKFEHSKPVCQIRSSKEGIGKDVGIYCWWFKDNCVLEWNYYPKKSKNDLALTEDEIINSGYYPLNIQGNRQTSKELRKKLGDMRKIICTSSQH